MLKFTAIAAFVAMSALSGSAFAAVPLTAVLVAPTDKPTTIVAEGTAWLCAGPACAAKTFGPDAASWLGCKALVRSTGEVSAYGALDAEKLAKCNATAKK
jgi:hypothetical protein